MRIGSSSIRGRLRRDLICHTPNPQ
jgi:hypothetical protein